MPWYCHFKTYQEQWWLENAILRHEKNCLEEQIIRSGNIMAPPIKHSQSLNWPSLQLWGGFVCPFVIILTLNDIWGTWHIPMIPVQEIWLFLKIFKYNFVIGVSNSQQCKCLIWDHDKVRQFSCCLFSGSISPFPPLRVGNTCVASTRDASPLCQSPQ